MTRKKSQKLLKLCVDYKDNSKLPNEKLEKNNHGIRVLFPNSNKIPVIAVMT